jgi:hypothetical protein
MLARWLVLLLVLTAPLAARADGVAPADAAAIRQVIEGQMSAFRADDWNAAFGFAAPAIQTKFGSTEIFRQMVTGGYQPVYRPKSVEFRALKPTEQGPTQEVFVIGPDGLSYLAYYTMERQADGSWRISGCYLLRAPDQSV